MVEISWSDLELQQKTLSSVIVGNTTTTNIIMTTNNLKNNDLKNNDLIIYPCIYCTKTYKHEQSLERHQKESCVVRLEQQLQSLEMMVIDLRDRVITMDHIVRVSLIPSNPPPLLVPECTIPTPTQTPTQTPKPTKQTQTSVADPIRCSYTFDLNDVCCTLRCRVSDNAIQMHNLASIVDYPLDKWISLEDTVSTLEDVLAPYPETQALVFSWLLTLS